MPPSAVRYLDHNATSPLDPRVRDVVIATLCDDGLQANPSSVHGPGQRARAVIEQARRAVARAIAAEPLEVTFTASGTEADNLAILGAARALRAAGRPCGVLTTALEHPAVLAPAQALAREGHSLILLPVDGCGRIDLETLTATLKDHPEIGVVSLAAANHELGNAYDVAAMSAATRAAAPHVVIHCDAVQAFGKLPIHFSGLGGFSSMGVDLLSLSAHKIYGPKGVGALVVRRGRELAPALFGGPQERGKRPGTESIAAIAGFGKAAELAATELAPRRDHTTALVRRLRAGLAGLPGARINGDGERSTGTTVNVGFAGCDGQLLLINLDLEGIAVSTGAACSSGTLEPSPVLRALGQAPEVAREALRISVGKDSTMEDVEALLATLPAILERVRGAEVDPAGWREVEVR